MRTKLCTYTAMLADDWFVGVFIKVDGAYYTGINTFFAAGTFVFLKYDTAAGPFFKSA